MRLRGSGLVASVLATALLVFGAAAQERDMGGHRQGVTTEAYPWSSVAKIFNSIGGACTGVVIGRAELLTAAHCLYARRTGHFVQPSSIHVLLGYERGDYRVHVRVARYRLGVGYDPRDPKSLAADWAVLALEAPLPAEIQPLRLAHVLPDAGRETRTAGYPQDRAHAMTADTDCRILGAVNGGRLFLHDCRTKHGNSGSPVLDNEPEAEILGLSVAVVSRSGVAVTVAIPAARIARELRAGS